MGRCRPSEPRVSRRGRRSPRRTGWPGRAGPEDHSERVRRPRGRNGSEPSRRGRRRPSAQIRDRPRRFGLSRDEGNTASAVVWHPGIPCSGRSGPAGPIVRGDLGQEVRQCGIGVRHVSPFSVAAASVRLTAIRAFLVMSRTRCSLTPKVEAITRVGRAGACPTNRAGRVRRVVAFGRVSEADLRRDRPGSRDRSGPSGSGWRRLTASAPAARVPLRPSASVRERPRGSRSGYPSRYDPGSDSGAGEESNTISSVTPPSRKPPFSQPDKSSKSVISFTTSQPQRQGTPKAAPANRHRT